jgi:hypothetical protein
VRADRAVPVSEGNGRLQGSEGGLSGSERVRGGPKGVRRGPIIRSRSDGEN